MQSQRRWLAGARGESSCVDPARESEHGHGQRLYEPRVVAASHERPGGRSLADGAGSTGVESVRSTTITCKLDQPARAPLTGARAATRKSPGIAAAFVRGTHLAL